MSRDTNDRAGYDIIGDIHGCAEPLEGLLEALGYEVVDGSWTPPEGRQAIFVGDLIDRGPNQRRVLEIVKGLVDAGAALITLGNHEFNALAWSTEHPNRPGEFLREHSEGKRKQHAAFLDQLTKQERSFYLEWFLSLPLWLDLEGIRVVHACWDPKAIELLRNQLGGDRFADRGQLARACDRSNPLFTAVDTVLKGPEINLVRYGLPRFRDKDGTHREQARLRWWVSGSDRVAHLAEIPPGSLTADGDRYPVINGDLVVADHLEFAPHEGTPIFFGHYWRRYDDGLEVACTENTACVDFSAAKGGPLVAYRWSVGEERIDPSRYVAYR